MHQPFAKHIAGFVKQLIATAFVAIVSLQVIPVLANDIELAISNDLIDLRFRTEYEKDFSGTIGFLHTDFENIESDQVSYTFETRGQVENVIVKLGMRLFYLDVERDDGFGAALGVGAQAYLVDKLSVSGQFYYAPEIITGGDLENTLDGELRLNYQLIENGSLFLGYRVYEVDAKRGGSVDIYDDPYIDIT
ncbi:MAG: YfaZ family outer membrane protein, partial [Pseudomonadales bacterium]